MDNKTPYRWQVPLGAADRENHRLKMLNSFTRKKEVFVPNQEKVIKWYSCGPTVYDVAHLGHARSYITFDIIRRILSDYFGYQLVFYVMNITDIDDKIIKRATERIATLGGTVDNQVKALTSQFEKEFFDDMQRLDVMPPSALTRVSQYIDEIGLYLKKLEANGYAYRSAGSVYFDTEKYDSSPQHSYAKLRREAYGQKKSLDEGEGELSIAKQGDKKSPNDFALWKKSKPGEPFWVTQDYEPGRPGWHIECSVMACQLLGESIDIHSGGCDLEFPHHDNEIAQAEAYYDTGKNWVNYFIHSGHLTIDGCKMSKSLKNFTSIQEALETYSPRQLRLAFLAHGWAETLNYSSNTMKTATSFEKTFNEFFQNVSSIFAQQKDLVQFEKWSSEDLQLHQNHSETVVKVDLALCDNFDTRTALTELSKLVSKCNIQIKAEQLAINLKLLIEISKYIQRILAIFGANFRLSLPTDSSGGDVSSTSDNNSEAVYKCVDALAETRVEMRRILAESKKNPQEIVSKLFTLCDKIRDVTVPQLGYRLEDQGKKYVLKSIDPDTLARAEGAEHEKELDKEAAKLENIKLKQ